MVATNLRLCTVKLLSPPDIDRRFCFQVVSPARSYILQGLSDDDVNQWVTILQAAIGAALNSGASDANDDSSAEIGLSRDKKVRRPAARRVRARSSLNEQGHGTHTRNVCPRTRSPPWPCSGRHSATRSCGSARRPAQPLRRRPPLLPQLRRHPHLRAPAPASCWTLAQLRPLAVGRLRRRSPRTRRSRPSRSTSSATARATPTVRTAAPAVRPSGPVSELASGRPLTCAGLLSQIPSGPSATWARSCASTAPGSIVSWVSRCHASARSPWTAGTTKAMRSVSRRPAPHPPTPPRALAEPANLTSFSQSRSWSPSGTPP